ncbi:MULTISPECIES: DJ-1/PfpI family protein [Amycolatopsis]|uniref:DJ-1/PfpI family protein n=1 Tax=Amycolatopsis TaxID=1813 RepID=UPI00093BB911|nr:MULTISPECIES: DJ-1/PfpI family protein [unclassified Amycolatopsis]OKK01276.1 thiamine biosynthesis protein ThiJ [Amycolatopsis sp. CB00013]RSN41846.1 DJ-1/PfpI family protein [Amycolatopsis sp. WAC 04197]
MTDDKKTIAFVVYPGMTPLDMVGPLTVLEGMASTAQEYRTVVVGETKDPVTTDNPLKLVATHTYDEVPSPYALLVPGGAAPTLKALADEKLVGYLRGAAANAELVTSVCTGSLLLGQAGLLKGRKAATHWMFRELLGAFGAEPVAERWVEDGNVITAAGVSAGIDLALHLVERLVGAEIARTIQFVIEYDPEPPQGPLDWSKRPYGDLKPLLEHTLNEALADEPALRDRLLAHTGK